MPGGGAHRSSGLAWNFTAAVERCGCGLPAAGMATLRHRDSLPVLPEGRHPFRLGGAVLRLIERDPQILEASISLVGILGFAAACRLRLCPCDSQQQFQHARDFASTACCRSPAPRRNLEQPQPRGPLLTSTKHSQAFRGKQSPGTTCLTSSGAISGSLETAAPGGKVLQASSTCTQSSLIFW